jgi:hypothetical protein
MAGFQLSLRTLFHAQNFFFVTSPILSAGQKFDEPFSFAIATALEATKRGGRLQPPLP